MLFEPFTGFLYVPVSLRAEAPAGPDAGGDSHLTRPTSCPGGFLTEPGPARRLAMQVRRIPENRPERHQRPGNETGGTK